MDAAALSGVIVTVPEAEPAVGVHRARLDRAAVWGVPAHVTVLFPFVPPPDIDASVLERLAAAVASVPSAGVVFARTGWFGDDVLWLAPEPPTVFTALTEAVVAAFPGWSPYGGEFDEVVPHLTVGHGVAVSDLRDAEEAVRSVLPIRGEVATAELWCGREEPASWARVRSFPLG